MGVRSQEAALERGEDWFEPVLNTHTPPTPLSPLFSLCPPSTQ